MMRHWAALAFVLGCAGEPPGEVESALTGDSTHGSTTCSYNFGNLHTGILSTPRWEPWNCTMDIPPPGSKAFPYANGFTQATCDPPDPLDGRSHGHHSNAGQGNLGGHVTCLYTPPKIGNAYLTSPGLTTCSYTWPGYGSGSQTHVFSAGECSAGTPPVGAPAIGAASTAEGIAGRVSCQAKTTTTGAFATFSSGNGASYHDATVTCTYIELAQPTYPEATLCRRTQTTTGGTFTRTWAASECTNGLPGASWVPVGQATAAGTSAAVTCTPSSWTMTVNGYFPHAISVTAACLFTRPPAVAPQNVSCPWGKTAGDAQYSYDLDGDGVKDTAIGFVGPGYCPNSTFGGMYVWSCLFHDQQFCVPVPDADAKNLGIPDAQLNIATLDDLDYAAIGDHTGDGLQEVSGLFARGVADNQYRVGLAVIDLDAQPNAPSVLGDAVSPAGLYSFASGNQGATGDLYVDLFFPQDPAGRKYPFLAPGYGDGWTTDPAHTWGYGCIFRHDPNGAQAYPVQPDACGPGFFAVNTKPPAISGQPTAYAATSWYREAGGYLQDLDGDGWDDLNLTYHNRLYAISGATGMVGGSSWAQNTFFDPANGWTYGFGVPTGYPVLNFHSGRSYGVHSSLPGVDELGHPVLRTVVLAASPVGAFGDDDQTRLPAGGVETNLKGDSACNASQWVGVFESTPGQPATRRLKWSHYKGFSANSLDNSCAVLRDGDFVNHCIHAPGDGLSTELGVAIVGYDQFTASTEFHDCVDEQCEWYRDDTPAWDTCREQDLQTAGTWSYVVLEQTTGDTAAVFPQTYVWGQSDKIWPGGWTYLVEPMTAQHFAIGPQVNAIALDALAGSSWSQRAVFPMGRPWLSARYRPPADAHNASIGDDQLIAQLTLRDVDPTSGDGGLQEVMIRLPDGNCQWWGHSAGALVAKPDPDHPMVGNEFECYGYPYLWD